MGLSAAVAEFEVPGHRLVRPLGRGGMATVYLAIQASLGRPVAVKILQAATDETITRFEQEARTIARLQHPHIVAIYEVGRTSDGQLYYTMPYLPNGDLSKLDLRDTPSRIAAVMRALAGALGHAHKQGIVHRDVKPENVLISDEGEVKIADFGLVRAVAASGITSASVILGTAAYLSPEQVRDGSAGLRSDVYSAGILTYELLTGSTPFTGDTPLTLAYQRLDHDVPRASAVIDGVPLEFDELVARATARDPADRYADALEMGADLEEIAEELALPKFRVPAPRNSAQHRSAALHHSRVSARPDAPPPPPASPRPSSPGKLHTTRQMTRGPEDWADPDDTVEPEPGPGDYEFDPLSGQFGGIALSEFIWVRQHARRMVLVWVAVVVAITGLVATAGWTIGSNLSGLL